MSGQQSPYSGSAKGIVQPIVQGVMHKKWVEADNKRKSEAAEDQRANDLFNYNRANDRSDLNEDLALNNYGELASDYLSPELVVAPGADAYGGALETLMGVSQGYNPTMAFNPFLGEYGITRDAVTGLAANAREKTAEGIERWEGALDDIATAYDEGRTRMREDVDARKEFATGAFEGDRAERSNDEATLMLNQWVDDLSTKKTGGSKSRRAFGRFIKAIEALSFNAFGAKAADKIIDSGKAKGASEQERARLMLDSLRAEGMSSSDIARHLQESGFEDESFDHDMLHYWGG